MENTINCAEECINGCALGDQCPHLAYREAASKFIAETSIDRMIEIAEESLHKRLTQASERYLSNPPTWSE